MALRPAAWGGVDTAVVSAGALTIHPLFTIVGARGASKNDADAPEPDDVQRVADVALSASKGNFIGPLVTAVTMVRLEISAHRVLLAIQPSLFSYESSVSSRFPC